MPGEIDTVDVTFNGDQNAGIYQSLITLNSNDPDQNTVELPVTMDVWGATLIAYGGDFGAFMEMLENRSSELNDIYET